MEQFLSMVLVKFLIFDYDNFILVEMYYMKYVNQVFCLKIQRSNIFTTTARMFSMI